MKIISSIIFLFCIFFFNSCSNQNTNQNAISVQSDTGVLVASNDQNLIIDTPDAKSTFEVETNAHIQSENPSNKKAKSKENNGAPFQSENNAELIEMTTVEIEEKEIQKTDEKFEIENQKKRELDVNIKTKPNKTIEKELPFNHDKWDQLVRKYVSASGKVNYKGIKTEKANLDAYLKNLDDNPIRDNWSKAKKMAYWINAYNAFTIKMIVDNYPVSSIIKLHGGKPWDVKSIHLGGKTYNLNNIENDILRPKYKDARIHFAVNCAAQSCPPILNQAWTESNLSQMLEKQTKTFINNAKFNTIKSSEVEISKIFEWYAVDFGNIVDYLNKYSNTQINKNAKVKYKEYDWTLNE